MNESSMLEREIAQWMGQQRTSTAPAGLLEGIVEATSRKRPAPRWVAFLREPAMRTTAATLVGLRGRRAIILAVVAVALAASLLALAVVGSLLRERPVASDDWFGYRGDAAHGGVTLRGPIGQPSVAWTFRANGAATTAIAIVGDRVVAGTDDGVVHALSLSTGLEEWRAQLDGAVGNPFVADGVVEIADTAGTVHALDLAGGAERWQRRTTFHGPFDATIADGSLFVSGGPDGILAALDPADGAFRWQAPVGTSTSPAFDGASIYEAGGGFRALDAATGVTRWLDDTGDDVLGAASVANGIAYLGALHDPPFGHLRAVDARTGMELWRADRLSSPTVADGVAFASSGDGEVSARDAVTGRELWRASLPGVTREPAFAGGILYVVSEGDRSVHALDAKTGSEIWRIGLDDQLVCCIAVAKGRIVVGSRSGVIYALGDDGVGAGSSTPGPSSRATAPASSAVTKPTPVPIASRPTSLTGTFEWSAAAPGETFNWPDAVAVDPGGRSWVADPWNDRFAIFEPGGSFAGYWATPKAGGGQFRLNRPNTDGYGGIAFARDGSIYILDVGDRRVVEFDADRTFVRAWGGFGSSPGTFLDPVAIAVGQR